MTTKERAEKIWSILFPGHTRSNKWDTDMALVIAELDEAVGEANVRGAHAEMDAHAIGRREGQLEGFAAAREQAAKICDSYSQFRYSADTMVEAENMAREIRSLKSPDSGEGKQ